MILKKFILSIAILIVSIAVFSMTTITVWFSWEGQKEFQTLVNNFNAVNPNYHVNLVYIPNMLQKLEISMSAGTGFPDLALVRSDDTGMLVNANLITPAGTVETTQTFKKAFLFNGILYAYPYYADTQVIYLNKSIYKGAIPSDDWTLSDFERIGKEIKDGGHIGAIINMSSSYFFNSFYAAFNGGIIPQKNGIPIVNNDGTIKAAEFYNQIFNVDRIAVSFTTAAIVNAFQTGKAGMLFQGSFLIPNFLNSKIDFTILPYPSMDDGQPIPPTFDAKGFVIFKQSEGVNAFLDYVTLAGNEEYFCKPTYKIPANIDAMKALENSNEFFKVMDLSTQNGLILPTTPIFKTAYSDAISTALQLYLTGKMSIQEALSKAQDYINSQVK